MNFSRFILYLIEHSKSISEGNYNFTFAVSIYKFSLVLPVNMNQFGDSEPLFNFVIVPPYEI